MKVLDTRDLPPLNSRLLQSLLQQELAAGNQIAADGPPLGSLQRLILFAGPFRTAVPAGESLQKNEPNDPHWWQTEVIDLATQEMIACR